MTDSGKDRKIRSSPAAWGLAFSFALSMTALIFCLAESEYPDKTLFLLLAVIRYSSYAVVICSAYLLIAGIRRMIQRPSAATALGIVLFFFGVLYGVLLSIINVFIVTIAGG
ncbi:MAG: hypothetical protein LBG91_01930, partial [Treponema sp.]|nr:hypothetical protein [Treponema sp.]